MYREIANIHPLPAEANVSNTSALPEQLAAKAGIEAALKVISSLNPEVSRDPIAHRGEQFRVIDRKSTKAIPLDPSNASADTTYNCARLHVTEEQVFMFPGSRIKRLLGKRALQERQLDKPVTTYQIELDMGCGDPSNPETIEEILPDAPVPQITVDMEGNLVHGKVPGSELHESPIFFAQCAAALLRAVQVRTNEASIQAA